MVYLHSKLVIVLLIFGWVFFIKFFVVVFVYLNFCHYWLRIANRRFNFPWLEWLFGQLICFVHLEFVFVWKQFIRGEYWLVKYQFRFVGGPFTVNQQSRAATDAMILLLVLMRKEVEKDYVEQRGCYARHYAVSIKYYYWTMVLLADRITAMIFSRLWEDRQVILQFILLNFIQQSVE